MIPTPEKIVEVRNDAKTIQGPQIYVQKWIDYSSKYGIGYMMSNGAIGVYMNDTTKIIQDLQNE